MIEDEELRELFRVESEEHLQHLDEGLLRLEKDPHDHAMLEEVFREAHSLKGAARMLGITQVETVAHRFEDILGTAKRGQATLTSDLIDRLYRGIDGIRQLVDETITGKPASVDVVTIVNEISGESSPSVPGSKEEVSDHSIGGNDEDSTKSFSLPGHERAQPIEEPALEEEESHLTKSDPLPTEPISARATLSVAESMETQLTHYRIETIRVDPQKLDALMTQTGELTVTKIRMSRRLAEISQLVTLWEEWHHDISKHRSMVHDENPLEHNGGAQEFSHTHERARIEQVDQLLDHLAKTTYEDYQRLDSIAQKLEEGVRTARLLPLSTIFQLFGRTVRDMARELSKEIELIIEGGDTTADKQILEEMKDPLMHMVRNAIDHGIETPEERLQSGKPRTGTIRLRAYQTTTDVVIEIIDDGRGLNLDMIKRTALKRNVCREEDLATMSPQQVQSLIFAPGFSTRSSVSDISGRGVGMDVVRTHVEQLKGTVHVESDPGRGCTNRIRLPMTLATTRVLLVSVDQGTYAIPVQYVKTTRLVSPNEIYAIEGRESITLDGQSISLIHLSELLEVKTGKQKNPPVKTISGEGIELIPYVVLTVGDDQLGCLVDELLDEQEVVLKPHSAILKRVRNVSGSTILGTGDVCIILNPSDLIRSAQKSSAGVKTSFSRNMPAAQQPMILVVEDSLTIRTQIKRVLEGASYEVVTATDGVDALSKLALQTFDAVVSDVQMPNMDGFTLTATIRQNASYAQLPIILFTSLSSNEDKQRGMEVGATAYISKAGSGETVLLETVRRLV